MQITANYDHYSYEKVEPLEVKTSKKGNQNQKLIESSSLKQIIIAISIPGWMGVSGFVQIFVKN